MIDKKNAKEWVNKFLEGETSNAEEEALYKFFANGRVPSSIKKYKPMFAWYANGMKDPLPTKKTHTLRLKLIRISVAASFLLLCTAGYHFYEQRQEQERIYDCYQGSYIIRNGKVYTNLKVIMPEIEKTMREAEELRKAVIQPQNKSTNDIIREMEQNVPNKWMKPLA